MEIFNFTGNRLAYIDKINDNGTYDIYFSDDIKNVIKNVPSVTIGSVGAGILCGYHEKDPVWCGQAIHNQPIILGYADLINNIEGNSGNLLSFDEIKRPRPNSGEIFIQSTIGSHIDIDQYGDIRMLTVNDDGIKISNNYKSTSIESQQKYTFTDSGITIEGRVKRLNKNILLDSVPLIDMLKSPEADAMYFDVCRDPSKTSAYITRSRGLSSVIRNPVFAEKREIIYEFADSFLPRNPQIEVQLSSSYVSTLNEFQLNTPIRQGYGENEVNFDNLRFSIRNNLLKLDYNSIIERVQGTLIDIYGNILDINYLPLSMPSPSENGLKDIEKSYNILNRSIAYHFQINTRTNAQTGTGKFSLDIDKEGQFKINIPRSTTFGNIASVTSITSNTNTSARIDSDILNLSKSNIIAPFKTIPGTAFHDITTAASRAIFNTLKQINPITDHTISDKVLSNGDTQNIEIYDIDSIPEYTNTILVENGIPAVSSDIPIQSIGGRSGLINMEGSLELSIGADDIDSKSLVLDTNGSAVATLGLDNHGRSAIISADGHIILESGNNIIVDNKSTFNDGAISIRVNIVDQESEDYINNKSAGKNSDHVIHITKKGIVISCGGGTPLILRSSGSMALEAAGNMDIKAKTITVDVGGVAREIAIKSGEI